MTVDNVLNLEATQAENSLESNPETSEMTMRMIAESFIQQLNLLHSNVIEGEEANEREKSKRELLQKCFDDHGKHPIGLRVLVAVLTNMNVSITIEEDDTFWTDILQSIVDGYPDEEQAAEAYQMLITVIPNLSTMMVGPFLKAVFEHEEKYDCFQNNHPFMGMFWQYLGLRFENTHQAKSNIINTITSFPNVPLARAGAFHLLEWNDLGVALQDVLWDYIMENDAQFYELAGIILTMPLIVPEYVRVHVASVDDTLVLEQYAEEIMKDVQIGDPNSTSHLFSVFQELGNEQLMIAITEKLKAKADALAETAMIN